MLAICICSLEVILKTLIVRVFNAFITHKSFEILFITGLVISSGCTYAFNPFLSLTLDVIMPLENATRPLVWPIYADYVIFNKEDHFYKVSFHIVLVAFFVTCLHVGLNTIFIMAIQHWCGLAEVIW